MMMQNCTLHLDQEQKTWLDLFMCVCVEYCSTWAAQPCVGVGQWHGRHYSRAPRGQCFGWGGWRENFFGGEQAEIWDSCRAWARVRIQPDRFLHGHQPSYLTGSVRVIESSIANTLRSDILVMLICVSHRLWRPLSLQRMMNVTCFKSMVLQSSYWMWLPPKFCFLDLVGHQVCH